MQKVRIVSKQIFEDYEDCFSNEYECEFIYLEEGFKILYDSGEVVYDGCQLLVKNNTSFLVIEKGVKNDASMNTPYGKISIEVTGEKILYTEQPFSFEVRYAIKLGNTKEYINELGIFIIE